MSKTNDEMIEEYSQAELELLEAHERYMLARMEHDKARDAYEGPSWDYAGRDYVDAVRKAETEFKRMARKKAEILVKMVRGKEPQ
jgi:hypothetical protein